MKIESYKNNDEALLWSGKPNKSVFIKEQIFSPFLIVAAIWLVIDIGVISIFLGTNQTNIELYFIIPFFILHLML